MVYVVVDGIPERRVVTLEGFANDFVLITSGLNVGETIISDGVAFVKEGVSITVPGSSSTGSC